MEQGTVPSAPSGPQPGELIPDFFGRDAAARLVFRREFKGRQHLLLCFAAPFAPPVQAVLLAALAARLPAIRAAGGEAVVFVAEPAAPHPAVLLADPAGRMHERYGATDAALLFAADRYGEIVLRRTLDDPAAALDEAQAALEWMQLKCSL